MPSIGYDAPRMSTTLLALNCRHVMDWCHCLAINRIPGQRLDVPSPDSAQQRRFPIVRPAAGISEFWRSSLMRDSAGSPLSAETQPSECRALACEALLGLCAQKRTGMSSVAAAFRGSAWKTEALPSPILPRVGKDGDNAAGPFSAALNCAYLYGLTQAMRRRKMDHELQGNKRSAQRWSSRTDARPCSVTTRS
ncbi:hypothetical protein GFM07_39660 [Rhizobium leguminosarum bv. viciae]|nr:hypothetical protein [Rhizobium leguminosarum bv. viciae]